MTALLCIVLTTILIIVSIVVHELGHYIICRCYKFRPIQVNFGTGRMFGKFQFNGTWFQFRTFPFGGNVIIAPGHLKKMGLTGSIILFLTGPGTQLIFAMLITMSGRFENSPMILESTLRTAGLIIAISSVINIIPFKKTNKDGTEFRSDGFQVRNMWRRRHQFKIVNEN